MQVARISALVLVAVTAGRTADPEVEALFKQARAKVLDNAQRMPRYTCVETVTRVYLEPAAAALPRDCTVLLEQRRHPTPDIVLHPYSTDRLRLDVTMSSRGEIFSWSGAGSFEDH